MRTTDGRPRWWGGVAMLVISFTPPLLLWSAPRNAMMVHFSANSGFDLGGLLSAVPALAAVTLLAPLVGYHRRDAILLLVPGVNVYIVWVIGCRVAGLAAPSALTSAASTTQRKDLVAG